MQLAESIKRYLFHKNDGPAEMPVAEAYDIWAGSYDAQPGNLMLDLDEIVFSGLLQKVDIKNKQLADIGCGTGRHWPALYGLSPAGITGYDVSAGMLEQLKTKYPLANTRQINEQLPGDIPAHEMDCIISTLTIAHIRNLETAASSWTRILKQGGDLLITDFHPALLVNGGKRSFKHNNKTLAVVNYVHSLDDVKRVFIKLGFSIIDQQEKYIDETVKVYYEDQNALAVYNRYKGMPVIYGLHLRKG